MNKDRVCIVTLSRYSDLFDGLDENLRTFAPGFNRILVRDGFLIDESKKDWLVVDGPRKFCYSENVNRGIAKVDPEADVLLIGDDVRLKVNDTIDKLHELAYSDPSIGMLSPRICGGADNELQTDPPTNDDIVYSTRYLALVCTYIKRSTLTKTGFLDVTTFKEGFGWDDVDYSRRVRLAGFSLAITSKVEVIHGVTRRGSESLIRNEKGDRENIKNLDDIGAASYKLKWGDNEK